MPFLANVRRKRRPVGSRAFAAFSPNAVIGDAVGPFLSQSVRETAAGCVVVFVMDKRKDRPAQVVQVADEVDCVNPHVETPLGARLPFALEA